MIKFGTDGWRGLIARDFTFENLSYVALATARLIKKHYSNNLTAVIGYDTRFLSKEFAEEVAQILAWQGINIHLSDDFSSTPQISYHTKQKKVALGVMITASHNPPQYNGYKLKANFGGPATPEQIALLENELKKVLARPPQIKFKPFKNYVDLQKIKLFDAKESYLRHIKKKIDIEAIIKANFKIIVDPMYGAGLKTFELLLPNVDSIHNEYNPGFGDLGHPEPISEYLGELINIVKEKRYDVGLATDGDADRLGVIDEDGNFVDSHRVFMILLKYLYEVKKKRGAVVKTVSLTSMVNKYCEKHGIELYETPVGFKHTAKLMNEKNVLIGGEESGGLGTSIHIPERDGIFNGLLLLEVMATQGKSLKQLCKELDEEFGIHRYQRRDIRMTPLEKKQILNALAKKPKKIGKYEVVNYDTTDGFKFFVDNGWLLVRASGTEPLLRFYAEADSDDKVIELLNEALKLAS